MEQYSRPEMYKRKLFWSYKQNVYIEVQHDPYCVVFVQ